MSAFGLTLASSPATEAPERYAAGTIKLGEATERVLMSIEVWSADDYLLHWRKAAGEPLRVDEPTLFCSDYSPTAFTCFAGWRDGPNAIFEQWVLRPSDVVVDGHRVRFLGDGKRNAGASRWPVALTLVEAFANQV